MHVTQDGPARHPFPPLAARGADQIVHVEVRGSHVQLPLVVLPRVARTVGVDLDTEPVGIGEIHRFADEMIGHSSVRADLSEVRDESAERRAIGQKNREVVETEQSATRYRSRRPQLAEMHDLAILSVRTEAGRIVVSTNRPEAEHFLVELDRTLEIRDLEPHSPEMRRFGKPVLSRLDSALSIGGCCRRHVILRCYLMCGKCYASAPS